MALSCDNQFYLSLSLIISFFLSLSLYIYRHTFWHVCAPCILYCFDLDVLRPTDFSWAHHLGSLNSILSDGLNELVETLLQKPERILIVQRYAADDRNFKVQVSSNKVWIHFTLVYMSGVLIASFICIYIYIYVCCVLIVSVCLFVVVK